MEETFKLYARAAKQRMVQGFWQQVYDERESQKQVAAALGVSALPQLTNLREQIRNQIYNLHYNEEEEFYQRVVEMLKCNENLLNPIGILADKELMAQMTPSQRQAYLLKLSSKYRACLERYRKEYCS